MNFLNKISNWYFSREALPYWGVLAFDSAFVLMGGLMGWYLSAGGNVVGQFWPVIWGLLISLVPYTIAFKLCHTYSCMIRYSSYSDLWRILVAAFCAFAVNAIVWTILRVLDQPWACPMGSVQPYPAILAPLDVCIVQFVLTLVMMFVLRVFVKFMYDSFRQSGNRRKVFIYGARGGAVAVAKGISNNEDSNYSVVGFVDSDGGEEHQSKADRYLMGSKVYNDSPEIVSRMKEDGVSVMIVSPLQVDHFRQQQELINELTQARIQIMMMPQPEKWDGSSSLALHNFHEVDIEDLLPRDKIETDLEAVRKVLTGKRILVTGAAGSIGSEISRQIAAMSPSKLILIDQAETPMHDLRLEMFRNFKDVDALTIVASITSSSYMEELFSEYRPEFVFHAAAYKHVPMMEDNPAVAVMNNIHGTRVIADLSVKYGVEKFVMISTDKAVNPSNVMGCSKRICEIYCQSLSRAIQEGKVQGNTKFITTRFGNVLGSNGSVIPLFREQIRHGGPVTVTHPDIIRYFMLIAEACRLVLEAGVKGRGNEIFVFDMGKPVRIADLAKRMIALSGVAGVKIKYVGLRPGEKMYEEVLSDKEKTLPTSNPIIFVAKVREYDYTEARENEDRLMQLASGFDKDTIILEMKRIVPEYNSSNPQYAHLFAAYEKNNNIND